jgi:hypothetical protein
MKRGDVVIVALSGDLGKPRRYVTTHATQCSFVQIFPAEAETTLELMRVQKSPDGVDAYVIFDQNGGKWGKVGRCS